MLFMKLIILATLKQKYIALIWDFFMVQRANIKTKWDNSGNIATSHTMRAVFPRFKRSFFNTPAHSQSVKSLSNNVLKFDEIHKKMLHTKKKIKRKGREIICLWFFYHPPCRPQESSLIPWLSVLGKCDFEEGVSLHFSALLAVQKMGYTIIWEGQVLPSSW